VTERIRVLIADDHPLFRDGLRVMLEAADGFDVVGEATTGEEAVAFTASLQPGVVMMDIAMPGVNGIEATRRIVATDPEARVLMLTMLEDDDSVFAALRAGARGYLLKNVGAAELLDALQRVHAGEAILAPVMAARLLEEFRSLAAAPPREPAAAPSPELRERELDVLRLVAQGLSNKEIADALNLSEHTVKTHLANILAKLHLRSRAHAAAYAVQAGLVREVQSGR